MMIPRPWCHIWPVLACLWIRTCLVVPTRVSRDAPTTSSSSSSTSSSSSASASSSPSCPHSQDSITFSISELRHLDLPSDKDELLKQLLECGVQHSRSLHLQYIRNTSVTCNDGSKAGYYLRKSRGSKRWLVFLEGGWYCFDQPSCEGRWRNTRHLMTSTHWPDIRRGSGIVSLDPEENPYFYNANLVYVPYCSSDTWSGSHKATSNNDFSFMGALIIQEVVRDLVEYHGLGRASKFFLAGSSAGGTGVLLNLDRVAGVLGKLAPLLDVRGIADSGWFLDNRQYSPIPCSDAQTCAPIEAVRKGLELWQGLVPEACKANVPLKDYWKCYFGYRLYPSLKAPVFVVQHLFDEAQITADNVGPPMKKEQWQYIHHMGQDMRRTLLNVSAVFAPACLSHTILSRSEWTKVSIDGISLPEALRCWEEGDQEQNAYDANSRQQLMTSIPSLITGHGSYSPIAGDDPDAADSKRRGRKKGRRRKSKRRDREKERERRRRQRERERRRSNRKRNNPSDETPQTRRSKRAIQFNLNEHDIHNMQHHANLCKHHLIDFCAWPQCNFACPKIRNPYTGEEMDFIDLLMQFGLDLSGIANALGMDLHTLQSMDHDVLLRLMVQNNR